VKATYGLTTITEDGNAIVFNVFEPVAGAAQKKAVIIGHGGMATKEFLKGYAIELACAGFVAVNFDFRAHGQSFGQFEFDLMINEIKAMKQYLISRSDIDINNLTYIGYSIGGYPGNQIIKNDTDFKCFVGIGTGLPYAGYLPGYEVLANSSRDLNILIIQALFDQAISLDNIKTGMGLRLQMSAADVVVNKLYGSFQDGNASMIYLDDNSDHLLLSWDETFIRQSRDWISNTFSDVEAVDSNFYVNTRFLILFLQVFGGLGLFFVIVEPLSKTILKRNEEKIHQVELQEESVNSLSKKYILYSLLLGIPGMLIVAPLILLPLPIAGVILALLGGQTFASLILLWKSGKKENISIKEMIKDPFNEPRSQLIRQISLGVILAIIMYVILYLSLGLNYIGMVPSLFKLPWVPIYFAVAIVAMLIFSIFFQMTLLPKFEKGFRGLFKNSVLTFGLLMLFLCTFIIGACIAMNDFFILIFLWIITPIALLVSFVSSFLYQKTGNILAGTIVNSLFLVNLVCTLSPYLWIILSPTLIMSM